MKGIGKGLGRGWGRGWEGGEENVVFGEGLRKGEDEEKKECYWQWENFIRQTIGACRVGEFGEAQLIKQLAASIAFTESP